MASNMENEGDHEMIPFIDIREIPSEGVDTLEVICLLIDYKII